MFQIMKRLYKNLCSQQQIIIIMGIQVETNLFKWLQTLAIIKDGRRTQDNKVQLSEQISMKLYDGVIVGLLIKQIIKLHPEQNTFDKLDAIKQNSTPAIRLYNWNILTQVLKKLGLVLDYAQKSKILNLDSSPVQKILDYIYKLHANDGLEQSSKPLQVDITEVTKKQQGDANNILEFFVISISKNFKLSPQHTLNLFLDNNKYLAHLLVKGVKNSFEPVFSLLADISNHIDYIVVTLFCTDQAQSVNFFLNAIKPALISKDADVCEKCLGILQQMHQTYKLNSIPLQVCKKWLREQGMNTIFFAIKRHEQLLGRIINVTYEFLDEQIFKYVDPTEKSVLWDKDLQKISFFSQFLINLPKKGVQQFYTTKQFTNWIKLLIKMMKKSKQTHQITILISVMGWMWENIQQYFQTNQNGLPNAYFAFLKTCSLHQSDIVFTTSIQMMFSMMQILGNRKNNNAPYFYKVLVNCFSFSGITDRISFISINFKEALKSIKNLPGGPLVDPLIKNLERQVTEDTVDLCRSLIEQNRITQDQIIQLIEVLSSLIFHNISFGMSAVYVIFDNMSIMNEEMLQQYLQKNSRNALAHFYSISTSIKRKYVDLKEDYKRYGKGQQMKKGSNSFTQQMSKHILLGNLIKFIQKCIQQSEETKQMLEPLLFHTYIRVKTQLKKVQQADLLIPLMKYYYPADDQLEAQIEDYMEELKPPVEEKHQEQIQVHRHRQKQRSIVKKNKSVMNHSMDLSQSQSPSRPLDSSMLKPSIYALKDLDKLKQKISDIKTHDQKSQKKRDLIQQKKQLLRSMLNEKRLIEFGAKNIINMDYKCIFDWNTANEDNSNRIHGFPDIRLFNLRFEEELAYTQDVDAIIKKYRKVWRFLFFKYSSFGAKQRQQFKTEQKINMAQIWKMLKQYDLKILKKQESHAIVRLINQTMKRKNDLQNLTYLGFEEYIFQMCNYGYNKSNYPHVPPGQKILLMIRKIKDVTSQRGGNIQLFENPEEVYFQETEVIRQFNRRLKENSEYILPEGYKKVRMIQLNYNYEIHPVNIQGVSSAYVDVYEILDEIFSECKGLGFHLTEPLTHKVQKNIAKPSLFQNLNQKLKDHKKGYLLPKQSPTTADIKPREKAAGYKNQYHPHINFSLGIKLGLAGINVKNRFIADQVAYWMDDMLDAIQKGQNQVSNKAKKKINNEALKKKRASLQKMKMQQLQYEKKYKNRATSIKAVVQVNRDKKKSEDKKKRQMRKQERQAQKKRQEKEMNKKLQEFKQAKEKLEERRKEEQNRRKQDLQKKKKEKQQYKKGVEQYFKKKKQELEQKQSQMKKAKEDDKKKEVQIEQKKQQFAKKLHYSILKKEEGVLQKIEDLKKGYDQVWTSKQIQDAFIEFNNPLRYLFDLLLKYQKSKISATNSDELSLNTLHFFSLKFKIVPFMIEKNTLAKIFKGVGRSNQLHAGIDFSGFKQALFRISVKSKDLLNNIVQTKKQKKAQMQKFLEKSQSDGNHFSIDEQISPSRVVSISPKKTNLTEQYLYNAEGVTKQTVKQMLKFLRLPSDRMGVEQRYREVMQSKNNKPKNLLIKQLKSELQ